MLRSRDITVGRVSFDFSLFFLFPDSKWKTKTLPKVFWTAADFCFLSGWTLNFNRLASHCFGYFFPWDYRSVVLNVSIDKPKLGTDTGIRKVWITG